MFANSGGESVESNGKFGPCSEVMKAERLVVFLFIMFPHFALALALAITFDAQ